MHLRIVICLSMLTMATGHAVAQLQNPAFDENGGSLDHWTTFNDNGSNVSAAPITPRSDTHVAKLFGTFNESPNWAGLFQNLPTAPGQVWEAGVYARHNTDDSLVGTDNHLDMKIEFYSTAGGQYGGPDFLGETASMILDSGSALDEWLHQTMTVTAPDGAVEARLVFVFLQYDYAPGCALIDDTTFENDASPIEWTMIWNDEFDGAAIDASKWRVEDLHQIKNNELQYYAPDDVYLQNGELVLRSQERTYCGYNSNGQWGCYDYTSGLVETKNRFATTYGKIEVRAKLPSTQGIWPAHWMMVDSGGWPPEIDIMELLGHDPTRVYMTHHWGVWPDVQSDGGNWVGPDFSQGYHTFAIEWTPDRIDWCVDDVVRFSSAVSIPREPFHIILNTAVGGNWPGNPDYTTVFPQYHNIDYVRVYMPAYPGPPLTEFVDDAATSAQADGVIDAVEYVASTTGINDGLGDRIGEYSNMYVNSGADGSINFAFESVTAWPTSGPFGAVIYIDSANGGLASTYELCDLGDLGRRLATGKSATGQRSDLYFAPGFLADYAICLAPDFAEIYELSRGEHALVNGATLGASTNYLGGTDVTYQVDDGGTGGRVREFQARLADVGVPQGGAFNYLVSMLNGDNAYRSNEFIGAAAGNPWDADNPGQATVVLKPGDFIRFQTASLPGDLDGDGDVDLSDLATLLASYNACAGDAEYDSAADLDGDGCVDLADLAALLAYYGTGV